MTETTCTETMNESDVLALQSRTFFQTTIDMRKRNELTDVTIICQERSFKGHKAILCGGSEYFRKMFSVGMKETTDGIVNLQGIHPDAFEVILDVLYCGPFQMPNDRVRLKNLLTAAHLLQIEPLFTLCCENYAHMITPEFFNDIWNTAELYDVQKVLQHVPNFLTNHFRTMFRSSDFLSLSFDQLQQLTTKATEKRISADVVVEAVFLWVKHEEHDRKDRLKELFESIDLSKLSPEYMARLLQNEELVQTSLDILKTLVNTATSRLIAGSSQQETNMKLFFFGKPSSGVQYFDLQTQEWSAVIHMSHFDIPDLLERAPVNFENHIYFIGGGDGKTVYKYKPFTPEVQLMSATLNNYHNRPWASSLDDMIYCVGGMNPNKERIHAVERYNPHNDLWELIAPTHHAFHNLNVVTLDEYLYAVDSHEFKVEKYDPISNQWTVIITPQNSANCINYYQAPLAACLGKLYVYSRTQQLWSYDPNADCWRQCSCSIPNVIKGMWSVCTRLKQLPYILVLDSTGILYQYDPTSGNHHSYPGFMKFTGMAWTEVLTF